MSNALLAYIGPGPGLTMVWAFIALLGTIALAILSLLLWPIRMMMRRIRGEANTEGETSPQSAAPSGSDVAAKSQ